MTIIKIYALDGSTQCGQDPGIAPEAMVGELEAAGIKASALGKRLAPMAVIALCGAATGMANLFEIDAADLEKVNALGGKPKFLPWLFDAADVEVYKLDGTAQCHDWSGTSLEETALQLTDADIVVQSSRKDNNGRLYPKMCGLPTGNINVHEIAVDDFPRAQELGFSLLAVKAADSDELIGDWTVFPGMFLGPLSPATMIADLPGHRCRVLRPGQAESKDLRFDRFNIYLDENDIIKRVDFH